MKNYDETIDIVFNRINEYEKSQRRKRRAVKRAVIPVCGFFLIALFGVALRTSLVKSNDFAVTGGNGNLSNGKANAEDRLNSQGENLEHTVAASSANNSNKDSSRKLLCYVNQIKSVANSDIAFVDPSKHHAENWDNAEMTAYLDLDLSEVNRSFELESYNHVAWYRNDDDAFVGECANFGYSNGQIKFNLTASKEFVPRDCIVAVNDEVIKTSIGTGNGSVDVKFYGTFESGTVNQPKIQKLMIAEFKYNRVNFRVESQNISVPDFYKIVEKILTCS